jgi:hypothetical protein
MSRIRDLTGKKFSQWSVLQFSRTTEHGDAIWYCQCSCGLKKEVAAQWLVSGNSTKCRECANLPTNYIEELSSTFWNKILRGAKKRKIPVLLSKQEAYEKFLKQDRKCYYSGVEIYFPKNGKALLQNDWTASMDRIDSFKPYSAENVQWVHKDINMMKGTLPSEKFILWCQLVTKYGRS